jgi:hypothetical protein
MVDDGTIFQTNTKYEALAPIMNEKIRRYWAASEAMSLGWGGGICCFPGYWTVTNNDPDWN